MIVYSKHYDSLGLQDPKEFEFEIMRYKKYGFMTQEIYHLCEKFNEPDDVQIVHEETCPYCHKEIPPLFKLAMRLGA